MNAAPTAATGPTVGMQLPELVIPITRTMIVATAIASRDYQDVHHDPGLAQDRGSPDIFMNILTSNGLAERFVTTWAGPEARVKRVMIRLGAPNHPGDAMTMTGEVVAVRTEADTALVEVAVRGENGIGMHLSGTVEVELRVHEETL